MDLLLQSALLQFINPSSLNVDLLDLSNHRSIFSLNDIFKGYGFSTGITLVFSVLLIKVCPVYVQSVLHIYLDGDDCDLFLYVFQQIISQLFK